MMIDDGEALSSMSRHVIHRERKCLSYSAQREFVKRELVDDPKPIDCGMYLFGDGTDEREREKANLAVIRSSENVPEDEEMLVLATVCF